MFVRKMESIVELLFLLHDNIVKSNSVREIWEEILSVCLCLFIHLSILLSIYLCIYLSLTVSLSIPGMFLSDPVNQSVSLSSFLALLNG